MKQIPRWASKRRIELPGLFEDWGQLREALTWWGVLGSVAFVALYLFAEFVAAWLVR